MAATTPITVNSLFK